MIAFLQGVGAWIGLLAIAGWIALYIALPLLSRLFRPWPRVIAETDLVEVASVVTNAEGQVDGATAPMKTFPPYFFTGEGTSHSAPGFLFPWRGVTAIGYWKSRWEPHLPDPAIFVDTTWDPTEREAVARYLDEGDRWQQQMGYSYCRFGCVGLALGSFVLTDGRYVWPEGLSHYVRRHQLRLPEPFIRHAIRNRPGTLYRRLEMICFPLRWRRWIDRVTPQVVHFPIREHRGWWISQLGSAPGAISPPRPPSPPPEQYRVWNPTMDKDTP